MTGKKLRQTTINLFTQLQSGLEGLQNQCSPRSQSFINKFLLYLCNPIMKYVHWFRRACRSLVLKKHVLPLDMLLACVASVSVEFCALSPFARADWDESCINGGNGEEGEREGGEGGEWEGVDQRTIKPEGRGFDFSRGQILFSFSLIWSPISLLGITPVGISWFHLAQQS